MGGSAWVTLATNDSYSLGALVLAHSLKKAGTKQDLVVLVTPGVTNSMKEKLSLAFNLVQEVNILDSKDESNLRLLKRPELGVTFTKLHCWRLTQYDKCVFLDADTLVLQNCDELFEKEELSAAPDVGWPDCFNSGVFVYRPSSETYEKLIQFALEKGSFDGGDQGLLNLYFSDWATKDISKHLPFIYNMCSTACYSYLPAFKQFGSNAKIIHFIGATKPWLQYFNTETRKVQPSGDLNHLEGVLQYWWDIFCSLIHPNLTTDMARSSTDTRQFNQPTYQTSTTPKIIDYVFSPVPNPNTPNTEIWDPWETYIHIPNSSISSSNSQPHINVPDPHHHIKHELKTKPIQSHNTNACYIASHNTPPHSQEPSESPIICNNTIEPSPPIQLTLPETVQSACDTPQYQKTPYDEPVFEFYKDNFCPSSSLNPESVVVDSVANQSISSLPEQTTECEAPATLNIETTLHTPEDQKTESNSGLAGAFAQLTLGVPRTAQQSAIDDHLRRQGWEVGNIDYLGKDSFENIWSKICETLSAPSQETQIKSDEEPPASLQGEIKTATAEPATTAKVPRPQESETEVQSKSSPDKAEVIVAEKLSESIQDTPKTVETVPASQETTQCSLPQKEVESSTAENLKESTIVVGECPLAPKKETETEKTKPEIIPSSQEATQGLLSQKEVESSTAEKSKEITTAVTECPLACKKETETEKPKTETVTTQCPLNPPKTEDVAQPPVAPENIPAETPVQCPLKSADLPEAELLKCPLKKVDPQSETSQSTVTKPEESKTDQELPKETKVEAKVLDPPATDKPIETPKTEEVTPALPSTVETPATPAPVVAPAQPIPVAVEKQVEQTVEKSPTGQTQEIVGSSPSPTSVPSVDSQKTPIQESEKPVSQTTGAAAQPVSQTPQAAPIQDSGVQQKTDVLPTSASIQATDAKLEQSAVSPAVPETPSSQPQEAQVTTGSSPKEAEQPKPTPETTPTQQPTPPPRKGSGGGKKGGKSKK